MTDPTPIDWDELWRTASTQASAAAQALPGLQGKADALYVERLAVAEHAAAVTERSYAASGDADRARMTSRACGVIGSAAQNANGRMALDYVLGSDLSNPARGQARNRGLVDATGLTSLGRNVKSEILRLTTPKETDQ
jgi:hypothetical protein